ncbi:MAG: isoprenyl transferase [Deltaproteobacteria bacterium]|nr:isoprenyl transferase [Deltaproteobacteria bacterium]
MGFLERIDRSRLPAHVAIIMDGNGRWATARGLPRTEGHRKGRDSVNDVVRAARELGLAYLTLYAFSSQNWQREQSEVSALMNLLHEYLETERATIMDNAIRLASIGDVERLPPHVYDRLRVLERDSAANTGMTLTLALSYGGREEIVRAAQAAVRTAGAGGGGAGAIDEQAIASNLYTAGMPDPDLVIRTGGEIRLSNFLLWQASYAELCFTETLWPDFSRNDFYEAIVEFQRRRRRFGMTDEQIDELGKSRA